MNSLNDIRLPAREYTAALDFHLQRPGTRGARARLDLKDPFLGRLDLPAHLAARPRAVNGLLRLLPGRQGEPVRQRQDNRLLVLGVIDIADKVEGRIGLHETWIAEAEATSLCPFAHGQFAQAILDGHVA